GLLTSDGILTVNVFGSTPVSGTTSQPASILIAGTASAPSLIMSAFGANAAVNVNGTVQGLPLAACNCVGGSVSLNAPAGTITIAGTVDVSAYSAGNINLSAAEIALL